MIEKLELRNFRGIESVLFNDLGRVNLIVGGNDTGKTSVLEALVLLFGDRNQLISLPSLFRQSASLHDEGNGFWPLLAGLESFENFSLNTGIASVLAETDQNGRISLLRVHGANKDQERNPIIHLTNRSHGLVAAGISSSRQKLAILSTAQPNPAATASLFNEIATLNPDNEEKLRDLVRESIEPRLCRLSSVRPEGAQQHLIHVDLGKGLMIPFTQMGQAFVRALHIYCEVFAMKPDILLIDEIENGLYYGGMPDFWKGLIALLEDQQVQLFATTHSRECMEASVRGNPKNKPARLRYLRLDRKVGQPHVIVASQFDQETMAAALEFGQDMR